MFCKQCGKPIDDGQELCEECKVAGTTTAQADQTAGQQTQAQAEQPQYQQQPQYNAAPNVSSSQKSKIAAGLLGIFLGSFGVHNFYLGYTGKAVAQLLLSLLSCGLLSWVSSIWGLIEGILIISGSIDKDGQGNPLRD